jgi:hypothetical protein
MQIHIVSFARHCRTLMVERRSRIAASDHVFNRKSETEINNDSFYPFQPRFRMARRRR